MSTLDSDNRTRYDAVCGDANSFPAGAVACLEGTVGSKLQAVVEITQTVTGKLSDPAASTFSSSA